MSRRFSIQMERGLFHRGCSLSLQFFNQDSSLEGEQRREDRPYSSHLSTRFSHWVWGHLITVGRRHVGLILPQEVRMNMHEVPSYYGSRMKNTTLGLRIGSIAFWKSPTWQPTTILTEFIAKQVPYQPDLYSKQERSVRTLWPDIKTMVSPTKLIVHSAEAEPISQSVSPSHLKTGKLEYNLRPCAKFWQHSSKFSS